jgi:hypothetical protein
MTAPTPAQTPREHDADDLVTEEMIEQCLAAAVAAAPDGERSAITACLRAVAPMIAARARAQTNEASFGELQAAWVHSLNSVVVAEREACAKIAETYPYDVEGSDLIAAAIRARGETP